MDLKDERRMRKLEKDLTELNALFIKTDQELRKKILDLSITNTAGVVATEFTLAARMGITMDVVLAMVPEGMRSDVEQVIARRVSELPDTTAVAMRYAKQAYDKDGDNY